MSTSDSLDFWSEALQLEGFRVVHVRRDGASDPVQLTIVPTVAAAICPHCQQVSSIVHRRQDSYPLKDLSFGPQAVELIVRLYQFECVRCGFFTPTASAFVPGAHATERFLAQAARLIRCSDIANAAAFLGVPEKTLEKWYYDYAERQRQHPTGPARPIRQLGIDELRFKGKGGQYLAVIVDHSNRRVLEVLESREKHVVVAYLARAKREGLLAQVVEVTTDMWDGYVEAAREVFGAGVRITIDRFHVMKSFQDRLTAARRDIQRKLPKEEAKALKGTRWLWLTNEENLSAEERAELTKLQQRFPLLGQLRQQRERLRALFEDRTIHTAAAGAKQLRRWMQEARALGLQALDAFCQTMSNWLDKIANYFVTRASNGRAEGLNRGLRSILWRAFGMVNFEHFRLRILDRFGRPA